MGMGIQDTPVPFACRRFPPQSRDPEVVGGRLSFVAGRSGQKPTFPRAWAVRPAWLERAPGDGGAGYSSVIAIQTVRTRPGAR
jgi:hypothetical protein